MGKNFRKENVNPARAGMVESLDQSVGRIMEKLEKLGIAEDTIIILTGDNGGNYDDTTSGLKSFKGFSHEGGVREPFIVNWLGTVKAGTTCDTPVIGTDFYPTFLDIAGLPARPDEHMDGLSILPLLKDPATKLDRDTLYWHYPHYHRTKPYGAIREGDWKLIEFFENGSLELYNLKKDQNETTNLAETKPKKAQTLLRKLKIWRKSINAQEMKPNPRYDDERADDWGDRKKNKARKVKK